MLCDTLKPCKCFEMVNYSKCYLGSRNFSENWLESMLVFAVSISSFVWGKQTNCKPITISYSHRRWQFHEQIFDFNQMANNVMTHDVHKLYHSKWSRMLFIIPPFLLLFTHSSINFFSFFYWCDGQSQTATIFFLIYFFHLLFLGQFSGYLFSPVNSNENVHNTVEI